MIKTKPWSGGTDEEYETQLFGFGAQRLKIAVRQMAEQKITTGVKDMESYLQESLDLNETDKITLTRSCDKLIRLYCERAGPSLDAIDEEIEKVLRIPPNVLLPEDEPQLEQTSDSDFEALKEEVANLRKRVERGALLEALLTAEEEELATVEKVCETAKKDMEVIDLLCKSTGDDSLKTIQHETQFLCARASFIKKQPDWNGKPFNVAYQEVKQMFAIVESDYGKRGKVVSAEDIIKYCTVCSASELDTFV